MYSWLHLDLPITQTAQIFPSFRGTKARDKSLVLLFFFFQKAMKFLFLVNKKENEIKNVEFAFRLEWQLNTYLAN